MAEMPLPVRGGSLELIRDRWHITAVRWGLVLGWLVIALLSTLPAPVLVLLGEQGTGKSLLMKLLFMLVDPGAPIGRPPASEERLQNACSTTACTGPTTSHTSSPGSRTHSPPSSPESQTSGASSTPTPNRSG